MGILRKRVIEYRGISNKNIEKILKGLEKQQLNSIFILELERNRKLYLGYIAYMGFKILNVKYQKKTMLLEIRKVKQVPFESQKESSMIIKIPRTGIAGKRIYVYKMRTMQPYSQYIQSFVIEQNGLNNDGTIKNDFRITKLGKVLRKYWLDELPMLLNLLNGDLKLIGVRPLGDTMLNAYPKKHRVYREQFKPGLIPPYYVDNPQSFDEIIESEKRYLDKYKNRPISTDIDYFYRFIKKFIGGKVHSS